MVKELVGRGTVRDCLKPREHGVVFLEPEDVKTLQWYARKELDDNTLSGPDAVQKGAKLLLERTRNQLDADFQSPLLRDQEFKSNYIAPPEEARTKSKVRTLLRKWLRLF